MSRGHWTVLAILLLFAPDCAAAEAPNPAAVQLSQEFEELLARPDASIDIATGALLVAKEQYPDRRPLPRSFQRRRLGAVAAGRGRMVPSQRIRPRARP